jgi:hypothetical protein
MANHQVDRTPLAPGTSFMQMARLTASEQLGNEVSVDLGEIKFINMLVLDDPAIPPKVNVTLMSEQVRIESSSKTTELVLHATMRLQRIPALESFKQWADFQPLVSEEHTLTGVEYYSMSGNNYQGEFQSVHCVWLRDNRLLAQVRFMQMAPPEATVQDD